MVPRRSTAVEGDRVRVAETALEELVGVMEGEEGAESETP